MHVPRPLVALATLALLSLAPAAAEAQFAGSLTGGIAKPTSTLEDLNDAGFTIQGRAEFTLLIAGLHVGAGYTRFSGKDITIGGNTVTTDALGVFNAGVGARLGLGSLLWVGGNGNWYTGDIDGSDFGIVPEIGASLGPIEAIADYKLTGDVKWFSLRAGIRF